jgi:hypothetical protein
MEKFGYTLIGIGTGFALIVLSSFVIFKNAFISFFVDFSDPSNQPVINLLQAVLPIAIGGYALDTVGKISTGALTGFYDTKVPSFMNIGSLWLGVMIAYWMGFTLGWGLAGIATANDIGLGFGGLALFGRFIASAKNVLASASPEQPSNYCARFWRALGYSPDKNQASPQKVTEVTQPEPKSNICGFWSALNPIPYFSGARSTKINRSSFPGIEIGSTNPQPKTI